MNKGIIYALILLLGLAVSSCSQPSKKTPPVGYYSCCVCSGTGKKAFRIGFLTFYTNCSNCNGKGYTLGIRIPGVSPIVIDNDDDDEPEDNPTGGNQNSGGGYEPPLHPEQVWVECFDCHGSRECSYCNGDGWDISTRSDGSYNSTYKCSVCFGTGNCQHCGGTGGHYETQFVP